MTCPFLKEVVMLYCDAYPVKKMIPLDRLVSTEPCLSTQGWPDCPLFREAEPAAAKEAPPAAPAGAEATR